MPRRNLTVAAVMRLVAGGSLAAALALVACRDGTAPADDAPTFLVSGQALHARADARHEARLQYEAARDEQVRLRFKPIGYGLVLQSIDSAGVRRTLVAATPTLDTTTREVRLVAPPRGATLRFAVVPRSGAPGGEFELTLDGQRRAPESHAAAITLDEVVEERMDEPRDADVYELTLDAPATVLVAAQLLDVVDTSARPVARLRPLPDTLPFWALGDALVAAAIAPGPALEQSSSGTVTVPAGRYQLVVDRDPYLQPEPANARYRVQVRRVNPAPEERSGELALGDSVASAIDFVGDVDEWSVRGTPGDSVIAFLQATGSATAVRLRQSTDAAVDTTVIAHAGQALLATSTGRLAIPASGTLVLRVEGGDGALRTSGGYRLFAYRPDTMPEVPQSRPAVPGETIAGSIELPGDVDTYAFVVTTPTLLDLVLERDAAAKGSTVAAQLTLAGFPGGTVEVRAGSGETAAGSGRMTLAPGTHRVRVSGMSMRGDGFTGGYRVALLPIDTMPESAPTTLVVGETSSVETLFPMGDVDEYAFTGAAGDTLTVLLMPATAGAPLLPLRATLWDPTGAVIAATRSAIVGRPGPETGRITLSRAGTYRLQVAGVSGGRDAAELAPAPYRVALQQISARPDSNPSVVAVGTTVREWLDAPGDIDAFEVTAPVGRQVELVLHRIAPTPGQVWLTGATIPADWRTGAAALTSLGAPGPLRATVRALGTGRVTARVVEGGGACSGDACSLYQAVGEYTLTAQLAPTDPEGRSRTIVIGDTVGGELDQVDDVDEFDLSLAAGDKAVLEVTRTSAPCGGGMRAWYIDVADGVPYGSGRTGTGIVQSQSFTAATPMRYVVRIDSYDNAGCGAGAYTVVVRRQ